MRTLNGVKLTEKEFRHIKTRYLKFAREENRCSHRCPMGWEDYYTKIEDGLINKISESIHAKTYEGDTVWCACQLFYEFEISGCPCRMDYDFGSAFTRLAKVAKRLRRMK